MLNNIQFGLWSSTPLTMRPALRGCVRRADSKGCDSGDGWEIGEAILKNLLLIIVVATYRF